MAKPELSVLTSQSLGDRIVCEGAVAARATAWAAERNAKQVGIDWQLSTEDARIMLKKLYPNIET